MKKFIQIVSCITILIFLRTGFALSADQVYFYYTDPAGTPMAMSDASGNVVWKADYMPFGEELLDTASVENNKMFVGKEKDKETGFYYFGARYMESPTGRFISPDPIGPINPSTGEINQLILHDPQRLNPYTYGLNNPYRYVDPDGKLVLGEAALVGIIVVATMILMLAATNPQVQKQLSEARKHQDSSSSSQTSNGASEAAPGNNNPKNKKDKDVDKDIKSETKRFSKRSLKDQIKEYRNLQKTYEEHLGKYGQEAGETSGETNRIERQLQEYRQILESRGQQVGP